MHANVVNDPLLTHWALVEGVRSGGRFDKYIAIELQLQSGLGKGCPSITSNKTLTEWLVDPALNATKQTFTFLLYIPSAECKLGVDTNPCAWFRLPPNSQAYMQLWRSFSGPHAAIFFPHLHLSMWRRSTCEPPCEWRVFPNGLRKFGGHWCHASNALVQGGGNKCNCLDGLRRRRISQSLRTLAAPNFKLQKQYQSTQGRATLWVPDTALVGDWFGDGSSKDECGTFAVLPEDGCSFQVESSMSGCYLWSFFAAHKGQPCRQFCTSKLPETPQPLFSVAALSSTKTAGT